MERLPKVIVQEIAKRLPPYDVFVYAQTCKHIYDCLKEDDYNFYTK